MRTVQNGSRSNSHLASAIAELLAVNLATESRSRARLAAFSRSYLRRWFCLFRSCSHAFAHFGQRTALGEVLLQGFLQSAQS
jgi:hypothetical protein